MYAIMQNSTVDLVGVDMTKTYPSGSCTHVFSYVLNIHTARTATTVIGTTTAAARGNPDAAPIAVPPTAIARFMRLWYSLSDTVRLKFGAYALVLLSLLGLKITNNIRDNGLEV